MEKLNVVEGQINWLLCSDLKVINAALGIMTHTSRRPCHICLWTRGSESGDFPCRTFEGITTKHHEWQAAGADPSKLKDYENCRNTPIRLFPSVGQTKNYIALSGLHFKLGLVNDTADELVEVFPDATNWMHSLNIKKVGYHGAMFEGRKCDVLLNNIDKLRELVANSDFAPRITRTSTAESLQHPAEPLIELFQSFKNMKDSCFGYELKEGWQETIKIFTIAHKKSGI